jgi:hypothetical protein
MGDNEKELIKEYLEDQNENTRMCCNLRSAERIQYDPYIQSKQTIWEYLGIREV